MFKRKTRDKPKVEGRTTGSNYTFYMGGFSADKNVNERSAMQDMYGYCEILEIKLSFNAIGQIMQMDEKHGLFHP